MARRLIRSASRDINDQPAALPGEEWRPIPSSGGKLEASSEGRIRSLIYTNGVTQEPRNSPLVLKQHLGRYANVGTTKNGSRQGTTVHSLVAEAFLGSRPQGMHVAHMNGDNYDNRPANLSYVTPKENEAHKLAHGTALLGERCHAAKLTDDDVRYIRRVWHPRHPEFGFAPLAKRFGVTYQIIAKVARGQAWRHVQPAHAEA